MDDHDRTSPPRLLMIEDEESIRSAFQELLSLEGYDLRLASDGEQGLELLAQGERPDLILLDMRMPRLDGPGFLDRCREVDAWANIPVVVVSATPQDSPSGARACLRKPCDVRTLLATIEACLSSAPPEDLDQALAPTG